MRMSRTRSLSWTWEGLEIGVLGARELVPERDVGGRHVVVGVLGLIVGDQEGERRDVDGDLACFVL